jgi:hypothetical protein
MEDNTGMIEFFYQFKEGDPAVSVRLSPESDLPLILESFEGFLRAAGYSFQGQVDIITTQIVEQDPNADLN